eukprot:Rmarinus@m.29476
MMILFLTMCVWMTRCMTISAPWQVAIEHHTACVRMKIVRLYSAASSQTIQPAESCLPFSSVTSRRSLSGLFWSGCLRDCMPTGPLGASAARPLCGTSLLPWWCLFCLVKGDGSGDRSLFLRLLQCPRTSEMWLTYTVVAVRRTSRWPTCYCRPGVFV